MRSRKLTMLLAVLALVVSTLACALGAGEPTLSNVRTARDEDGTQVSSVFGAFETVYAVSDLTDGVQGNVVTSKWYAVNVEGVDPNFLIDTANITVDEETFTGTIYFFFEPPDGGWPSGAYRVEILFNNQLVSSVDFSIQ